MLKALTVKIEMLDTRLTEEAAKAEALRGEAARNKQEEEEAREALARERAGAAAYADTLPEDAFEHYFAAQERKIAALLTEAEKLRTQAASVRERIKNLFTEKERLRVIADGIRAEKAEAEKKAEEKRLEEIVSLQLAHKKDAP